MAEPMLHKKNMISKCVCISQSLGLDLVNINVYAKVNKIFHSVQEIGLFSHFSEFEPQQRLGQSQMTFDNILGYILSISMRV